MTQLIQYDKFPYNSKVYAKIANQYIGDTIKTTNRRNESFIIKIDYINKLSWQYLQLICSGSTKITKMVNLYNRYALKKGYNQIIDVTVLKEELTLLEKYDCIEESKKLKQLIDTIENEKEVKQDYTPRRLRIEEDMGEGVGYVYMSDGMWIHEDDCWW